MSRVKLAVVGCGAQAELQHLPAIAGSPDVELVALVDTSVERARLLADRFGAPVVLEDYRKLDGLVDAAVIALPNHLHGPVSTELAARGLHVLVEKPMATTSRDCEAMIDAAAGSGAVIAVGLDFRFLRSTRLVKRLLDSGVCGDVRGVDLRMGNVLPPSYVLNSDYLVRKEAAGGGGLIDLGVHAVDLLLWWLGDHEHLEYFDDAAGGVEANSEIHLGFRSGAVGFVEISRVRRLRNTCIIRGTRGILDVGLWTSNGLLRFQPTDEPVIFDAQPTMPPEPWAEVFSRQLADFVDAIRARRPAFVSGVDAKRSIDLIEACYAQRRRLPEPWNEPSPEISDRAAAAHVS